MEYIIVMQINNRRNGGRQRHQTLEIHRNIRDITNPFADPHFRAMYRLTPDMALSIINEIKGYYPKSTNANAIPVEIKFLAALNFYAQGSYQKPDGRDFVVSLSQASVSRAISQTTNALNSPTVLCKWVQFPRSVEERQLTMDKNYRKFKIPGVLGFVDGTHIIIKKPVIHEGLFINRKGQHSLNVQVVCNADLKIINILAKFPGSTHDAYVWKASAVRSEMAAFTDSWFLGDSGYPLEPWLLTPVLSAPDNTPEARYTQMHIRARNAIERCFGVWKSRFRCLHKHRTLEYAPTKAGQIINACAVLHNICISDPEVLDEDMGDSSSSDQPDIHTQQDSVLLQRAMAVRASLINRLFP